MVFVIVDQELANEPHLYGILELLILASGFLLSIFKWQFFVLKLNSSDAYSKSNSIYVQIKTLWTTKTNEKKSPTWNTSNERQKNRIKLRSHTQKLTWNWNVTWNVRTICIFIVSNLMYFVCSACLFASLPPALCPAFACITVTGDLIWNIYV